jgi:negative regulator of replication initiation
MGIRRLGRFGTTIGISPEVARYLTETGQFGETPDDVLRRMLRGFGDSEAAKTKNGKPITEQNACD